MEHIPGTGGSGHTSRASRARNKITIKYMISNERTWPSTRNPYRPPYQKSADPRPPRPFVHEDTLKSGQLQVERKHFLLMLKENPRGRFVRISEEVGGRINSIIIPATGLEEFHKILGEMVQAAAAMPAPPPPETPDPMAP
jgi:hypothetical protein